MKDRIIYESIASLRREGLRFSVDTLAERLNVSKKTVYKYFSNKEELAFALYQRYYEELEARAVLLAKDGSDSAHSQLLLLYFDAKSMTSGDIFNKYKLNEAVYSYTCEQNDDLLAIIFSSLNGGISNRDKESLRTIINGAFEKLCNEKKAPEGVMDWLVKLLW
ncbi:MAG: TetR/AcrR family transcriptional regulator [Eubacteriales bacterium]